MATIIKRECGNMYQLYPFNLSDADIISTKDITINVNVNPSWRELILSQEQMDQLGIDTNIKLENSSVKKINCVVKYHCNDFGLWGDRHHGYHDSIEGRIICSNIKFYISKLEEQTDSYHMISTSPFVKETINPTRYTKKLRINRYIFHNIFGYKTPYKSKSLWLSGNMAQDYISCKYLYDKILINTDVDTLDTPSEKELEYHAYRTEEHARKEKEAKERAILKEERKSQNGYCDHCGEPAEWTINPYHYDMNNTIVKEWLCTDCYNSIAGDI